MNDKQQLQGMGLHLSEQQAKGLADAFAEIDYAWELLPMQEGGLCMAKQIEDLQARLLECAQGAAKMQEQRDAAYVMAGKSGLERDKFAQQLKAANRKIAVMAELLREVRQYPASDNNWGRGFGFLERIDAALAGKVPDHVSGVGEKALPEGWKLIEKATCFALVNDGQVIATMAGPAAEDTAAILAAVLSGNQPDHVAGVGNMVPEGWKLVPVEPTQEMVEVGCEHEGSRINDGAGYARVLYAKMLAAAPKPEPTK
ncbi:MAG: hypothetical protein ACRCXB_26880 [Aeromonadaceae bacterium]